MEKVTFTFYTIESSPFSETLSLDYKLNQFETVSNQINFNVTIKDRRHRRCRRSTGAALTR